MGKTLTPRLALSLVIASTLSGCSAMGEFFGAGDEARTTGEDSAAEPQTQTPVDADGLAFYLDYLNQLVSGDTLDQAAAFNEARDAAEYAPTTRNRLLYALVLSVPGHTGSDAAEAADRLADLLAASNVLSREERLLAEIQLESANAIRILRETNRNAERELDSARSAQDAEHAAEVATLEAENEALRAELENVQTMLDAITNIEQSLSEREDTDE